MFRERKAKKIEKQASSRSEKAIPIATNFFCGFISFMRFPCTTSLIITDTIITVFLCKQSNAQTNYLLPFAGMKG